jgi:MFS family permease
LIQQVPAAVGRATRVRHVVLGLTVIAYMITYMDRQILAVARPVIRDELGISLVMMGWITFGFRMAYALFQIPGGWVTPHRHTVAFPLDASHRARLRAGRHARRLASGRRAHAAYRGADHRALRLARGLRHLRDLGNRVGRGLVHRLSRHWGSP